MARKMRFPHLGSRVGAAADPRDTLSIADAQPYSHYEKQTHETFD